MEQENQENTMDNLAELLELNGFNLVESETTFNNYYTRGVYRVYWDNDKDKSLCFDKGGERFSVYTSQIDLAGFIQCLEVKLGKLKRLPKALEFDSVKYLTENLPECSIKIKSIELSIYLDNCTNAFSKCALHLLASVVNTKEQCDKIIEAIKILQEI